jgi:hypothetical protein
MNRAKPQTPQRPSLNIRISQDTRALIDRAAALGGKTRTDFILDAAKRAAEDALLDRSLFCMEPSAYENFLSRLDAPAQPNEKLRRTLQTPLPWQENN